MIVFNPPYLPEDEREDKESARATSGGKKGDEIIVRFLCEAKEHLEDNGEILLVMSSLTPMKKIEKILRDLKMGKKIIASERFYMEELSVWEIRKENN